MPLPITLDASHLDLSPRLFTSVTVAGSPALAAETIVCSVTCTGDIASTFGVVIVGTLSFTVGTSGVSAQVKIRRTDASGATKIDTGALTGGISATNLVSYSVVAVDAGGYVNGRVYVMTLQIASGAAVSTVSQVSLVALVV